jgi:hypothetical protein
VGDAFGPNIGDVNVSVGGVPCLEIAYIEEHYQLLCETSLITGADKLVSITVDGLTSADNFFSYHAPVITSVSVGPTVGGMVRTHAMYSTHAVDVLVERRLRRRESFIVARVALVSSFRGLRTVIRVQ